MIKLLRFKMKRIFHEIHDMIEVDSYSFKELKAQRQLRSRRIFEMINILKSVYIVFVTIMQSASFCAFNRASINPH